MFSIRNEHGRHNLWRQTALALVPLVLALVMYPFLPGRVYVPTAMTSLSPWGVKGNIFIYPVFCLILWLFIWAFIFFNRLYEKNLKVTHQSYHPLENYYVWGGWVLDILATVMVIVQAVVSFSH